MYMDNIMCPLFNEKQSIHEANPEQNKKFESRILIGKPNQSN